MVPHPYTNRGSLVVKQGTIKFYASVRGYGFIEQDGGDDIFFHMNNFESDAEPAIGMKVSYELGVSPKNDKPEARNVTPVGAV
jgi:CspA family cold shock protein